MTEGARRAFHKLLWAVIVLFIVTFAIGAANLLFTTGQVHHVQANGDGLARAVALEQKQIRADCKWYGDVASLPVVDPPGPAHPSITLPRLISDSRLAWVGHSCQGRLPVPEPSFVQWATFYHLPVVRGG